MADLDKLNPSLPIRPLGQEPRREAPQRETPRRRRPAKDGLTDDQGERRDEPPLVDDYA